MPLRPFETLPDDARLWSFGCSRPLTHEEATDFLRRLDGFLDSWRAHGQPLEVGRHFVDDRLLLVAVDERSVPPSGCSIDALVHALKTEGERLGAQLVDNSVLWYRDGTGTIQKTTRMGFAAAVTDGDLDGDTRVFDFTTTRLGEFREGRWETQAGKAWHARAFGLRDS